MTAGEDMHSWALIKLGAVFGRARAEALLAEGLAALDRPRIATPDDLYQLGQWLSQRTGFEQAMGSMLAVQAILRGARSYRKPPPVR